MSIHLRFVLLSSFYLLTIVNNLYAQDATRAIIVNLSDSRGAIVGAKVILKSKSFSNYSENATTDKDGNSYLYRQAGVYDVIIFASCTSSKQENIRITADEKPLYLNIKLPDENCEMKAAQEEIEWKICEQDSNIKGLEISEFDKAKVVNKFLEDSSNSEIGSNIYHDGKIKLSTENIKSEWIKPFSDIKITLLSPSEIQAKADKDKYGTFHFYYFDKLKTGNNCAFVSLTQGYAISKSSKVTVCANRMHITYLYRKEADQWKMVAKKSYF